MKTTAPQTTAAADLAPCWIEKKAADLIARARRSEYAANIFADARHIHEDEGLVLDVALSISCNYWLWDPRTA